MTTLPLTARLARSLQILGRAKPRARAYAQLSGLDDRMLNDIGLTRIDVEAMRRMW